MAQLATSDRRRGLLRPGDHVFQAVNDTAAEDTV